MPFIPTIRMRLAPSPVKGDKPYPWQFELGQAVYVKDHPYETVFAVLGGELWMGFPHYVLLDNAGKTWRVAQIQCSSKSLEPKKVRKK